MNRETKTEQRGRLHYGNTLSDLAWFKHDLISSVIKEHKAHVDVYPICPGMETITDETLQEKVES